MRKNVLPRFTIFDGASLGTDLSSPTTNIEFLDNVCIQLQWTTSDAVGEFTVEVSMDGDHWTPLGFAPVQVNQVDDHSLLDLVFLSAPLIRVRYTRQSGSGSLTGFISAKML
jgi:hypothetical protein